MESFVQLRRGTTPDRIHADVGELKDDEMGRNGFIGRQAQFYRRNDPTAFRSRGPIRDVHVPTYDVKPTDLTDAAGDALLLFSNADARISVSRRSQPMPFYARNIDCDEVYFAHLGTGRFYTEFGTIPYRPGDYIYLPKSTTYRHVPDGEGNHLLLLESYTELKVPSSRALGRHWPFDSTMVFVPEAEVLPGDGRDRHEVRLAHSGEHSWISYDHDPCDAEGWRGDNFPFRVNIEDYNVMLSDTVHLPPSVSVVMATPDLFLINFLPRPAEGKPGTERTPWYHRNVDFDEVAFYHGGHTFGVQMPLGLLSHAPQGIHHGAPERARQRARRLHDEHTRVEWQVVNIDSRRRLVPTDAAKAYIRFDTDPEMTP
jgi:homogentisate 1,2-dioxygenase